MKIVKATGLVPVHTKHNTSVFGVTPAVALDGVKKGNLFFVDIPDEIETITLETTPVDAKTPVPVSDDGVVQIPDDWENLHYAKQIVIAKQIFGADLPETEEKKPVDVARDIIREELSRRAAGTPEPKAS